MLDNTKELMKGTTTYFITLLLLCMSVNAVTVTRLFDGDDHKIVITVNRTTYTIIEGETWNLAASYQSNPVEHYLDWVRFRVPLGDLGGRRSGGTLEEPSLTITDIWRNDTGFFEMFVNNSRGLIYGPVVNLTVWYPPCCIMHTGSMTTVIEEDSFDIPVSLDAFPYPFHIDWLVNGVPVDRSTGRFVNGNLENPSLGVRGIQRTDEGNYSTTATNNASDIVHDQCVCNTQIVVNYKPEMTCQIEDTISIPEGNAIQLGVTVEAKPPISFLDWLRNDKPVDRTSGRFIGGNVTHPNLTVQPIQRADSGVYSVFSNNSVGSNSSCKVTVDVHFRPTMECLTSDKITVPRGATVHLPVSVQANPALSFLDWFKDGQPVDRSTGRFLGGNSTHPNLTILVIEPVDSGRYTVFSNNTVGSQTTCNVTIDVQYPPLLTCVSPSNISVEEFSQFTLHISVQANPFQSHVEWFKDGKELDKDSGRFLNGNVNIPSLTVINVQKNDTGLYTVYVNNSMGVVQGCNISVSVLYKPTVTCLSGDSVTVNMTQDFVIPVTVDANPPLSFVDWIKDNAPIDRDSGRIENGDVHEPLLTVRNAQLIDIGTYTIFANNTVGSVTACNVNVIVEVHPIMECMSPPMMVAPEGSVFELYIRIQANPPIGFLDWLKDGQPVDRTSGRIMGGNTTHPNLTILAAESEDSGRYSSFSNNTVGSEATCNMTVDVTYSPRLSCLSPSSITVEEFSQFTLNLSIQANPGLSHLEWFRDGKELDRDSGRFQNGNVDVPPLTVVNVQKNDSGLYTIYVNNSVDAIQGCNVSVAVHYSPALDCLTPDFISAIAGSSVHLPVRVETIPALSHLDWLKNNQPVDRSSGRFQGGNTTHPSLTVTATEPGDSGRYTVFANNTVGSQSACNVTLDVQYPPDISCLSPTAINVEEFSQFTLNVSIQSNPHLSYLEWFKDEKQLDRDSGRFQNGNVDIPPLTVINVQKNDSGQYKVYVNNSLDAIEDCLIDVDVHYDPIVTCLISGPVTVNETDTVVISVSVDANPPPSFVDWLKDSVPINRSSGRFENGDVNEPSLTIKNIQRVDAGRYSIFVNNTAGSVTSCDVEIIVQVPPTITNNKLNYTVCENASVTLDCHVSSSPPIHSLTWLKGGHLLDTSSPRYSGGTVAVPSLTIKEAIESDQDVYHCSAENIVGGSTSSHILLRVLLKPLITDIVEVYTLTEGTTAEISCSVEAEPRNAVVKWYKDGVRIQTRSSRYSNGDVTVPSLTINRVVKDDAGMYVCAAINDVGDSESQTIQVNVRYSPIVTVKYNNYGVAKGTTVVIWCEGEAFPAITNLQWRLKDGTPVLPKPNCTDVSPSYKLCRITESDSGFYQCVATNDVDMTFSRDVHVFVRDECVINVTDIRLSGGTVSDATSNGRLEVVVDGVWGTACGKDWTERATQVVCGMFGFSSGVSGMYGAGSGPIHLGHVACDEDDTTLNQCGKAAISNCSHEQDIWLNCSVPMFNATSPTQTSATSTIRDPTATTTPECPTAAPVITSPCECLTAETYVPAPPNALTAEQTGESDLRTATITLSALLAGSIIANTVIVILLRNRGNFNVRPL